MANNSPGDYIGWGTVVWIVGVVVAGVVATQSPPWQLVAVVAGLPGVLGGVMIQIGVIGWGVRIGMRAAHADEETSP